MECKTSSVTQDLAGRPGVAISLEKVNAKPAQQWAHVGSVARGPPPSLVMSTNVYSCWQRNKIMQSKCWTPSKDVDGNVQFNNLTFWIQSYLQHKILLLLVLLLLLPPRLLLLHTLLSLLPPLLLLIKWLLLWSPPGAARVLKPLMNSVQCGRVHYPAYRDLCYWGLSLPWRPTVLIRMVVGVRLMCTWMSRPSSTLPMSDAMLSPDK